ncbi:MAG: hypothetical protein C0501_13805 [Isosphaera sp.]|nr:hypothetical protein [Isosphaera sp.]
MTHRSTPLALVVLGAVQVPLWPAAPVPKGSTQVNVEEVKKRVYGSWKEVRRESAAGVIEDPQKLFGYSLAADGFEVWCRRGELSGLGKGPSVGVRLDPAADPMRIDFLTTREEGDEKKVLVTPGIFRFDGQKLVVVTSTRGYEAPRDDGNYPSRPTSFTRTEKNGYEKMVLESCTLYDQDR